MKKFILMTIVGLFPMIAFAQLPAPLTQEHISNFAMVADITLPASAVPRVASVPAAFLLTKQALPKIVDQNNIPQPFLLYASHDTLQQFFAVEDSQQTEGIRNLGDHDLKTYTEFAYSERGIKSNTVVIDLTSEQPVRAKQIDMLLDEGIRLPHSVRVAVVEDGEERIVLPQRKLFNHIITFPEVTATHFRVTFQFKDILRIRELTVLDLDVDVVRKQDVRFLARPDMTYKMYYDADVYVDIPEGEAPDLTSDTNLIVGSFGDPTVNPLYRSADGDGDDIANDVDNCPTTRNEDQVDIDGNGRGDACEDFDKDGVLNADDNCPDITNRLQSDVDLDGVGDACDDFEDRFLAKYPWLPLASIALVTLIVLTLIVRTFRIPK